MCTGKARLERLCVAMSSSYEDGVSHSDNGSDFLVDYIFAFESTRMRVSRRLRRFPGVTNCQDSFAQTLELG